MGKARNRKLRAGGFALDPGYREPRRDGAHGS